MENPWHAPVVAVEDGRVQYAQSGLGGCMLYLYGRSGTMYLYIHLNNDLTRRTTTAAGASATSPSRFPTAAKVTAGQQIAWVGDSGDANGNPHLHFEVHPNGGSDVDPFKHLVPRRASRSSPRARAPCSASRSGASSSPPARERRRVNVERVRQYPGGSWLDVDPRSVELTAPLGATVAPRWASDGQRRAQAQDARAGRGVHRQGEHHARGDPRSPGRARARPRRARAVSVTIANVGRRRSRSNP